MAKMVGIVTWYKNGNFGGTLQAYAISVVLKKMGFEPEFINFNPKNIILNQFKRNIRNVGFHMLYPISAKSREKIWSFVKCNLDESPLLDSYDKLIEYAKKYEFVICGSDQIWCCANGLDKYYFLQFVDEKKRIAYAPSIGFNTIQEKDRVEFKKYVCEIPKLSIREKKGMQIVNEISGREAKVVLDPTLLLDAKQWIELLGCKKNEEKYILCYFLNDNFEYIEYTEKLKKETGLKAKFISSKRNKNTREYCVCGINDFVSLIMNAEYVLTDSFHGIAFSINFHKKFAAFKRFKDEDQNSQNSRIYNLLSMINAEDLIINPHSDIAYLVKKNYDYATINDILATEREKSIEFLNESLYVNNL